MAVTASGLLLIRLLNEDTWLVWVLVNLIVIGFGFDSFSCSNMNAIMTSVDQRYYGGAAGVVGSMRMLDQTMSMGIASVMFALYIGPVKITPEVHPAILLCFKSTFFLLAGICLIGIPASLARGKIMGMIG